MNPVHITPLPRVKVHSSNVASVGYDPATYTLDVGFKDGSAYRYHGVPQPVYDAFMNSHSKGTFLRSEIRGRFRHAKLS